MGISARSQYFIPHSWRPDRRECFPVGFYSNCPTAGALLQYRSGSLRCDDLPEYDDWSFNTTVWHAFVYHSRNWQGINEGSDTRNDATYCSTARGTGNYHIYSSIGTAPNEFGKMTKDIFE